MYFVTVSYYYCRVHFGIIIVMVFIVAMINNTRYYFELYDLIKTYLMKKLEYLLFQLFFLFIVFFLKNNNYCVYNLPPFLDNIS